MFDSRSWLSGCGASRRSAVAHADYQTGLSCRGWLPVLMNASITALGVVEAPVGEWVEQLAVTLPMLDRTELLTLATFRALLEVDTRSARSTWFYKNETELTEQAMRAREVHSVVRAESIARPGDSIVCGAPSPGAFTADWTLRLQTWQEPAVIETTAHCRVNGAVVNADLLERLRDALVLALARGPGLVTLKDGPPELTALTRWQVAPLADAVSPLAYDYLLAVPEQFHDGARIPMPEVELPAVCTALDGSSWPSQAGPCPDARLLSLCGGRPEAAARLRLGRDAAGSGIIVDLPGPRPPDQRTFRAAMSLLRWLEREVEMAAPASASALRQFVDSCLAHTRDPHRVGAFEPVWDREHEAEVLPFGLGLPLPVGVVVDSGPQDFSLLMMRAQAWLHAFERTWTRGLRTTANRSYLRRGPSLLRNDEGHLPYLRFVHSGPVVLEKAGSTGAENWFWEAHVRGVKLTDGRRRGVLLASGLSRTDDYLCYGAELAYLFARFAWLVSETTPDADIRTLTLWL